ncbi:MAG: hypothetical protein Q4E02_01150 [Lagierella massiliensis]|nr:hypothetical protein [Lagierella massiliensis]
MENKKITLLGIIAGVTIAGRIFLSQFPNIQPVTTILLFVAIYLGIKEAIITNILVVFLSNIYLGLGPWTIYQIITYAIIIVLASLLSSSKKFRDSIFFQVTFSIISGFIYGFIISVFTATTFSKTTNFIFYYLNGLYFDLLHGIGNGIIYFLIVPPLKKALDRYFI